MHQRTISLKKTIAIANLISLASTSFIAADAAQAEGVTASQVVSKTLSTRQPLSSKASPLMHFDHSYKLFAHDLALYVKNGLVDYARWQRKQGNLDKFLKQIDDLSPIAYDGFTEAQKKAFWINAYNALTIKSVLQHYPIHGNLAYYPPNSFRQIPNGWETLEFNIMDNKFTLYSIEHDELRRGFRDPRVHFAVVCAAMGSGRLPSVPYSSDPTQLDQQLENSTRQFLQNPANVSFDAKSNELRVSKIFNWFTLDFACKAGFGKTKFPPPKDQDIIATYISLYQNQPLQQELTKAVKAGNLEVSFLPYDWALNELPR
ncbi:MAG: DUF547 domain-containing protein [Candidatus Obscuribacterales bacterium]|jgi:hypothetical protein|nr:DUF547 domain-containing protein [Candidatus Obscuribacterales bacterium]